MRFELFVAWRNLRTRTRRTHWYLFPLVLGLGLLLLSFVLYKLAGRYDGMHPFEMTAQQLMWQRNFQVGSLGCLVGGVFWTIFGFFHSLQSIFTTISTVGVFLGTASLVIVLSVMNGFEADLQKKILGSNAHMLVTREDGPFTEWRDVERRIDGSCTKDRSACVVAHTPFVTSEVVVAANSNYQPLIIKGIDPASAPKVTDVAKNLSQGSLERVWPLLPDGGVAQGATTVPPDAGISPPTSPAASDDDEEPEDFSGGGGGENHGPNAPPPPIPGPRPPRPLRPDPRVSALDGLLVGKELAKNLRLYEGEEVDVISPLGKDTPAGQVPRTRSFRVAGVFFTGMYEYDAKFVYASIPALQSFLGIGDEVTGIEIKVSDLEETKPLVAALKAQLGPGYIVKDWQEINKSLFAALKLEQIAMFLVLTIITLVASFSIVSNLIMVVVQKAREIASLKAMGASNGAIMRVFVAEGLYIGLLGTVFGLAVGLGTCWALQRYGLPLDSDVYYIDRLPVAVEPLSIAFIAIAGVAISVLATVYPAYVGATLRPVDGLRQ